MKCYRCGDWPCSCSDGITLINGDCREVLPEIGEVDLVLTDPPYGVGFRYASFNDSDKASYARLMAEVLDVVQAMGVPIAITPGIAWLHAYPPPKGIFCWFKPGSVRRSQLGTLCEWEPVLFYGVLPGRTRFGSDVIRLPDCANHAKDAARNHPCPKPLELYKQLISRFDAESICDPFSGSGTMILAAKQLGRRAIGIEIEERYCEIAANRLRQGVLELTG